MLFAAASVATGASPATYETIRTTSLSQPARVLLLRPPSFASHPERRYPVLYFLHDAWSDETALEEYGVADELFRLMSSGDLPEFLVAAPGARGSWFSDSHDGKDLWEKFVRDDLPRWMEEKNRAIPGRKARAATGISMGGYGAVKIALKYPYFYGSVSALSGALIPFGREDLKRYSFLARWTILHVFGRSRTDNTLAENDVWGLLSASHFDASPFPLYLRGGTEDVYGLGRVAAQFAAFAADHGIAATAVLEPGVHDWTYWRRALIPMARWHARQFSYDSDR
ncbi:MAG TPA: alpha/beta hydrolase-fold protein [Thermoanaerobaculia bacterium]|nr:alpha/beta hydrolase-fold protein [Thermoanaerobaculia bacterium]